MVKRGALAQTLAGLLLVALGAAVLVLALARYAPSLFAQSGVTCSAAYRIDQTLPTGARWEMCWEPRALEGIVLYDITFTPPGGPRRLVLAQMNLAQVHVPYDDNGGRFHDITDFGFGGPYLQNLTQAECPGGTLLGHGSRNALCQTVRQRGYAQKYYDRQLQGYELELFSVSTSGDYNYIPSYTFRDDGSITPEVGAAGKLQRYGVDPIYGWKTASSRYPISHFHNYWFRLDFDIDGLAGDTVDEIQFNPTDLDRRRTIQVTPLNIEAGRSHAPGVQRSWRIRDGAATSADGNPVSYHIEATRAGHDFVGPSFEPFSFNDLYVTTSKTCEQYTSHNPTTGGCGADVTQFLNGEDISSADVVVWYGVTFHHLPREEDENWMDVHWDGFDILPRDWTGSNWLDGQGNSGTSTPTRTPTSEPDATPTSTSTPTSTPGALTCSDLIVNGGFESVSAWSFGATPWPAGYTLAPVYAGAQALRAGIPASVANRLAYSSVFQKVTLPATATTVVLRYWERPSGAADGVDFREALVLNSAYGLLQTLSRSYVAGDDSWRQRTFDLSALRGRSVVIYFNVYNNGAQTQFANYYDNVELVACGSGPGGVQPPPSALRVAPAQIVVEEKDLPQTVGVTVTASSDGLTAPWEAQSAAAWIRVAPDSGQTPGNVEVTIEKGVADTPIYEGTLTLHSAQSPTATTTVQVVVLRDLNERAFLPAVNQ